MVSLIRFSFSDSCVYDITAKIRHFYDLHFLLQDEECAAYIASEQFRGDFTSLMDHDRAMFEKPEGWSSKPVCESPLLTNFDGLWKELKETYLRELPAIAFSDIPSESDVAESFRRVSGWIGVE